MQKTNFTLEDSTAPEDLKLYYRQFILGQLQRESKVVCLLLRGKFYLLNVNTLLGLVTMVYLCLIVQKCYNKIVMIIRSSTCVGISDLKSDIWNTFGTISMEYHRYV